jgi:TRAP-type mannitol/chloroaromatic compound transport system permease small subunit
MALVGLIIFQNGGIGKSWLWIILGIMLNVAGDMIFSYTTAQGTYYNGHLSELLFIYGYLFFTIAFYVHTKEL